MRMTVKDYDYVTVDGPDVLIYVAVPVWSVATRAIAADRVMMAFGGVAHISAPEAVELLASNAQRSELSGIDHPVDGTPREHWWVFVENDVDEAIRTAQRVQMGSSADGSQP